VCVSARPYQSRRRERQVLACAGLRGPADYWLTRRRPLMLPDLPLGLRRRARRGSAFPRHASELKAARFSQTHHVHSASTSSLITPTMINPTSSLSRVASVSFPFASSLCGETRQGGAGVRAQDVRPPSDPAAMVRDRSRPRTSAVSRPEHTPTAPGDGAWLLPRS
jgi:hypothetical protein